MLAAIRPAGQDFPVLLHIVGATLVFGALLASATSLALARGEIRLLRLRSGKSDGGLLKLTMVMALVLAVAYVVAVWAMTGKPTGASAAPAAGPGANSPTTTAVGVSASEFKFTLSKQSVPAGKIVFT